MFSSYLEWVYNSLEFILLCFGYCFRYSPIFLTTVDAEFISSMLCIDGLSFFLLYHQTNSIFTVTECYLAFVEFHLQIVLWFMNICDSIAQCMCCRLIRTSGNVAEIFKPLGATLGASSSQVLSLDTRILGLGKLLMKPRGVDPISY